MSSHEDCEQFAEFSSALPRHPTKSAVDNKVVLMLGVCSHYRPCVGGSFCVALSAVRRQWTGVVERT